MLALAAALIFFGLACRDTTFAVMIVVAMFVTRPSADVAGFAVRLENLVGLVAWCRIAFRATGSNKVTSLSLSARGACLCIVSWLAISLVIGIWVAPSPSTSLPLIAWTAGNVGVAIWIAKTPWVVRRLLNCGVATATVFSVLAIAFWALAASGISTFGTQPDTAYGGNAAYVSSIEANLLAGLICLWTLVHLSLHLSSTLLTRALPVVAPFALLATHTRAAILAFGFGIMALVLYRFWVVISSVALGSAVVLFAGGTPWLSADAGLSKFLGLTNLREGTGAQRVANAAWAFEEFLRTGRLVFGNGFNSFGQTHYEPTLPGQFVPAYVGSLPIQLLYDGGVVALILVGSATVFAASGALRRVPKSALVGIVGAYTLLSFSTSSLWLLQTWLFAGLALAASSEVRRAVSDRSPPSSVACRP